MRSFCTNLTSSRYIVCHSIGRLAIMGDCVVVIRSKWLPSKNIAKINVRSAALFCYHITACLTRSKEPPSKIILNCLSQPSGTLQLIPWNLRFFIESKMVSLSVSSTCPFRQTTPERLKCKLKTVFACEHKRLVQRSIQRYSSDLFLGENYNQYRLNDKDISSFT